MHHAPSRPVASCVGLQTARWWVQSPVGPQVNLVEFRIVLLGPATNTYGYMKNMALLIYPLAPPASATAECSWSVPKSSQTIKAMLNTQDNWIHYAREIH